MGKHCFRLRSSFIDRGTAPRYVHRHNRAIRMENYSLLLPGIICGNVVLGGISYCRKRSQSAMGWRHFRSMANLLFSNWSLVHWTRYLIVNSYRHPVDD
jgi:hypothetical protein